VSSISFSGLATGLDTKSLVEQLLSVEARPKTRLEWKKALWDSRKSTWTDLNTRLQSLQTYANTLMNPATWNGTNGFTSSDPSRVTGTVTSPTPAAGTYTMDVAQTAANEVWGATGALPAAVGGARQSGAWYQGAYSEANGSTLLTSLTDVDGTALGLQVGSVITMSATKNGAPVTASRTVTASDTLDDLANWAEGQFAGSSFYTNPDGTVTYQSAPGAANEITALSFSAQDGGSALTVFNGTAGASSSFAAPASGGLASAQTLTVTMGASTWNVALAAGDTEASIAAKINATAGIGVNAAVSGGKLQLTSNVNGAAGDFSLSSTGSLLGDIGLTETTAGRDANFTVNGVAYTRDKNTGISDVIAGVDLSVLNATASQVTLTVQANGTASPDAMKKKIMDFVNQYNAVVDFVNQKTGESKVASPKNLGQFLQGPMSRDFRFSSVGFDLRAAAGDYVDGLANGANTLADLGITSGAIGTSGNTSGRLQVDEAKLDAVLATDPNKARQILGKAGSGPLDEDGIAKRMSKMVSQWRNGGLVDAALQGTSSQITTLQNSITRFEERLERRKTYYEKMFSSLETRIGRIQSQTNWLQGQFASLSR